MTTAPMLDELDLIDVPTLAEIDRISSATTTTSTTPTVPMTTLKHHLALAIADLAAGRPSYAADREHRIAATSAPRAASPLLTRAPASSAACGTAYPPVAVGTRSFAC